MKLITFETQEGPRLGALLNSERALDLAAAWQQHQGAENPSFASMQALIDAGTQGLEDARALIDAPPEQAVLDVASIRLLAPLPLPMQLRDFANYEKHVIQALDASMRLRTAKEEDPEAGYERLKASGSYVIPKVWYDIPLYYKCNRFTVVGHETDIQWPHFAESMDYELELACVIGTRGRDITRENAREHIFGFTIFNDFSARDVQARWEGQFRMGPAKGKDFDTGNSFGPCIVTTDELTDPYDLTMIVRVNGEERGRGNSGEVQHDFECCIEQVSMCETLYPGEIFGLGTVGNGCGFETLEFLESGDVVELEVEGVGILRNRVVKS